MPLMQNIISQVPSHFTKVLYFPRHNEEVSHFPIYEISEQYFDKIGKLPMGSRDYKVELCLLRKPNGEFLGDNARFLVDVGDDSTSMSVRERILGQDPVEAQVLLPNSEETEYSIHTDTSTTSAHSSGHLVFPLPEKQTKRQLVRYPYFAITSTIFGDRDANIGRYEWQVHPNEKGPLRYELVDVGENDSGEVDSSILAIYHHHGFENELPASYSHGVLLLPSTSTSEFEIAVVSSLLAVLSAVRQQPTSRKQSRIRSLMACL
ncbi:hypothetical protein FPSE_05974 [Fusarium pseudograminearum CS3096]|uniref:Uncharacterized protein n=1 Tax=Fusarium pseudograminearum (strain CS3096) TaxID=1028729 RepID=K3UNN5_FUSPC|nr:hypothetical protein FPSE_05974 [Fusarium pseudograminearum CS3096]EKJ73851.1 hypothetical protein FPSE_05974 [Fusarium pseudograminearum CS3096]